MIACEQSSALQMNLRVVLGLKESNSRLAFYMSFVILQNPKSTRHNCNCILIRPGHVGIWEWRPSLLATCLQSDNSGVNSEGIHKMHG